jgi:hypothetical protein
MVESRGVASTSTTSSATCLCSDGRLGGSFQLSRARMFSCTLAFERVTSSVRRFNSRTCSRSVWNTSSSIGKTGQHPSLKKIRRAVALGGTSRERVRPPQSGHTPTFEGSLSTRNGLPSVGRFGTCRSWHAPASLSQTSPSGTRDSCLRRSIEGDRRRDEDSGRRPRRLGNASLDRCVPAG